MEMKFCSNCQKEVPESSFFLHQIHCEKNIYRCDCGLSLLKLEKEAHDLEYHSQIECEHCQLSMEAFIFKFHQCEKEPKTCKFCELLVTVDQYAEHVFQCGSRTELCKLCFKYIPLRDYTYHTQEIDCRQYQAFPHIGNFEVSEEAEDKELALALAQIKEAEAREQRYKMRREALTELKATTNKVSGDYAEYLKRLRASAETSIEETKENCETNESV